MTKGFDIINELLQLLCGETNVLTPSDEIVDQVANASDNDISGNYNLNDVSALEKSTSEIEGTPTGRRSPILEYKKPIKRSINASSENENKCSTVW